MYSSLPPSLPAHVPVLQVVGPNPDQADVYTEADRRGLVEQEQIDQQVAERADYQHRLKQIQAKRSSSNIHANNNGSSNDIHAAPQPSAVQLATLPVRAQQSNVANAATFPTPHPAFASASAPSSSYAANGSSPPPPGAVADIIPPKLGSGDASRASSLHLDSLDDEQIRALLDPKREDVAWKDMAGWSEDKLDALVAATRPQHLPELLRQSMAVNELQPARMLEWRDLTYVNKLRQPLLKNVTGYLAPGQMVGVFAGPDAGGTPLLNVLGQRKVTGSISGSILYDHRKPDETFNKTVGYIMKDDPHLATLTVYVTQHASYNRAQATRPRRIACTALHCTAQYSTAQRCWHSSCCGLVNTTSAY